MNCLDCDHAYIKKDTVKCTRSKEVLTISDVYYITFCKNWKPRKTDAMKKMKLRF